MTEKQRYYFEHKTWNGALEEEHVPDNGTAPPRGDGHSCKQNNSRVRIAEVMDCQTQCQGSEAPCEQKKPARRSHPIRQ